MDLIYIPEQLLDVMKNEDYSNLEIIEDDEQDNSEEIQTLIQSNQQQLDDLDYAYKVLNYAKFLENKMKEKNPNIQNLNSGEWEIIYQNIINKKNYDQVDEILNTYFSQFYTL